ncbi:small ribosomal subunit Rsm22 family protein [Phycicoccus sonneratiae]|uniref:rRNA methyltransferase n=1 Tax=Phycicoccus sonneratiae TaxID=2807628 RepID=A0ABS2CH63_9MICO|nr:small ribosomal subunit Rsm22 family protein [Phycicoccus sonneraticus]MBM6399215.1 rRNA methyltransferase [Phycicoccus sonneraticus]
MALTLTRALEAVLDGEDAEALRRATARLIEVYRSGAPPEEQALRDPVSAAAYAAYRMPATHAAVSRVLRYAMEVAPDLAPRSLVDVGGGTGAAAWAVAEAFPEVASVEVLDASADALSLGARIARNGPPVVAGARWTRADLTVNSLLPQADLATISYVLGELPGDLPDRVVDASVAAAGVVAVVEPGTPRGFAAVHAARERLLGAGWHLVAPCPHEDACPLAAAGDWCHLAVRLDRTALHRRLKGGALGHEDEKVSYVVARREPAALPGGRVLRHPVTRKGMVRLELCRADGTAAAEVVSKRQGPRYRAARHAGWGDRWPPEGTDAAD